MVEFSIYGENFDIKEVSDKLGMTPDESWIKGDRINNQNITRKETCWSINTGYQESLDINVQLDEIISKIGSKREILVQIQKKLLVECKFDIVIKIENNQSPAIYLERDKIAFANIIQAEFDFDLYVFS